MSFSFVWWSTICGDQKGHEAIMHFTFSSSMCFRRINNTQLQKHIFMFSSRRWWHLHNSRWRRWRLKCGFGGKSKCIHIQDCNLWRQEVVEMERLWQRLWWDSATQLVRWGSGFSVTSHLRAFLQLINVFNRVTVLCWIAVMIICFASCGVNC